MFFLEHVHSIPTKLKYNKVKQFFLEEFNISFSQQETQNILDLYPRARIKVATQDINDTDTKDELSFVISHFFLGCPWPVYGDKIDIE